MISLLARQVAPHLTVLNLILILPVGTARASALTEADAITLALARAEPAALDGAEVAEAEAEARAVPRLENPDVVVSRERVSGSLMTETEWRAAITQPIGLAGAQARQRRAAQAEAGAIGADVERRREQRIADVRTAYARCRAAEEREAVIAGQAQRLARAERAIGLKARAGDASGYDRRRIALESGSVAARAATAGGDTRAACIELALLTGTPDALAAEPLLAPSAPPAESAGALPRADLTAQQRRAEAARLSADAARRRQLPDLAVGVGYRRVEEAGLKADGAALSLGLSVPLFASGAAASRAAEARASAERAQTALLDASIRAERDAARARAHATARAAAIAQGTADEAERLIAIAEAGYQGGETGITELVDGLRAGSDARLEAIDHAERARLARIQLDFTLGGTPR
jgi:cobalt-zinc-cadmium efflux system outer membrane protein